MVLEQGTIGMKSSIEAAGSEPCGHVGCSKASVDHGHLLHCSDFDRKCRRRRRSLQGDSSARCKQLSSTVFFA